MYCGILLDSSQDNIEKSNTHSHLQYTHIQSVMHSLHSFINFPESLPDECIQTYRKFILSALTDVYVLAMVSPQINTSPEPTFDTKPYFVIMQTLVVTLAQIILIFHVILSSHSLSLPSPRALPSHRLLYPPPPSLTSPLSPSSIWSHLGSA